MATVTKLKAAIINKNLPILGEDGNLYNYYVGRYSNKLSDLGISLSIDEVNALNAFIESGVSDGWIDKVIYFMPFIGDESTPLSGLIPLIDNGGADYSPSVDSVGANNFLYSNGKIVGMGNNVDRIDRIEIPVDEDLINKGAGFFFNLTKRVSNFSSGYIVMRGSDSETEQGIRFNTTNPDIGFQVFRLDGSIEKLSTITKELSLNEKIGLFHGFYTKTGTELQTFKRYVILENDQSPFSVDMMGTTSTPVNTGGKVYIGGRVISFMNTINCIALLDTEKVLSSDMYKFNQAVFTLTTALGK